jgi:hypothetical protein
MVRAILSGSKTQTRRIKFKCDVGDILWVRETWKISDFSLDKKILYKADENNLWVRGWKPAIFMPREACRLFLRVEALRVERLRDIAKSDAKAEGAPRASGYDGDTLNGYVAGFRKLWDGINAKRGYGWDANPLVTVIEFKMEENNP